MALTPSLRATFGRTLRKRLETAETFYRPMSSRPELSAPEQLVVKHGFLQALNAETHESVVAHASVNYGRWLVRCPWCKSAQYASTEDQRFFCVECANAVVGGRWVRVVWPENRAEIEAVLCRRPARENRNWELGEAVQHLELENRQHAREILGGS